jgi:pyrimidine-specific ribonucleoside hydrolase
MALNSAELDVRGVVLTWGNNDVGPERHAAERLLRIKGADVPLVKGAAVKLSDPQVGWFEGTEEPEGCVNDGVRFMARELARARATVVAIGPLTDVACLVQNYPRSARRINRLIALMGRGPDETFSLTSSTFLPTTSLERLADSRSRVARYLWRASGPWIGFWTETFGYGGADPSAEHGIHPWDQNAVYRAITDRGCVCRPAGYRIVPCGPQSPDDPTSACAGHTPQTPIASETAQLWLSPEYGGRQVTACTAYESAAERERFERLALALAR